MPKLEAEDAIVMLELNEKHAHAYQVIAVFAVEPVDRILKRFQPFGQCFTGVTESPSHRE